MLASTARFSFVGLATVGGPGVPNHYRAAQFLTDAKLGGCFGALGRANAWQATFWKDPGGQIHPDVRWTVETELAPGQRWTGDDIAYLWVFALRDADDWREIAAQFRQAEGLLTLGKRPE